VTVRIVDADHWKHGDAKGVCKYRSLHDLQPVVEAIARSNQADLAVTLIHEYAHALLHFDIGEEPERAKREVEAEAVAYIVGRYFGLDTSDLCSISLRGRAMTRKRFKSASVESVPPLKRSLGHSWE